MKLPVLAATSIVLATGVLTGAFLVPGVLRWTEEGDTPADAQIGSGTHEAAFARAIEHLRARSGFADVIWQEKQLQDVLPNVEYSLDGEHPRPLFGGVIHGRVAGAAEGSGYRHVDGESVAVEFGSPEAVWWTVILTIEVENDFDRATDAPATVQVAVPFTTGIDSGAMIDAFLGRDVLAVLSIPGSVNLDGLDESVRMLGGTRTLIGFVAEDGTVSMPTLGEEEAAFLNGLTTLKAIIAASEEPKSVITVNTGRERE